VLLPVAVADCDTVIRIAVSLNREARLRQRIGHDTADLALRGLVRGEHAGGEIERIGLNHPLDILSVIEDEGAPEDVGGCNFGGGNAQLDFRDMKFDWACG
jgi:hypothetical protein